ncbi:hypothetical protein [Pseudalkalibacillus hwajinpoensis]|uniref:Uncharacterized protein n=1 Tax=Guptibacillus hwajinpoensis TaxID=208199 RepID=A0A4U1MI58_9BACL|nr:hypothetical protein [Pseudalkalibacillus hwajinpoensis]TKD70467.1 hypothetical protein FBF83_07480 [Pseudalkalibacillus hwajinpoensis]
MPLLFLLLAILTLLSYAFMISPIMFLVALASSIYYSKKGRYIFGSVVTFMISAFILITMVVMALIFISG